MKDRIELGGDYDLCFAQMTPCVNNLFSRMKAYRTEWYDSGRSAIRSIPISDTGQILLPEYTCESVIRCFEMERVKFYQVHQDTLKIDMEDLLEKTIRDTALVMIPHYFGYLQDMTDMQMVRKKADENGFLMVEDTTHSILSDRELLGDYGVASIRKWMPVHQGGVLYSRTKDMPETAGAQTNTDDTKMEGMLLKHMYVSGVYQDDAVNQRYREISARFEKELDCQKSVKKISNLARFLVSCFDVDGIISRRKENARHLSNYLKNAKLRTIREFREEECPFCYPVCMENRDEFRSYLIRNRVYAAVHWPFDRIKENERLQAKHMSETFLSLPIDQRYDETEISYMMDVISGYGV